MFGSKDKFVFQAEPFQEGTCQWSTYVHRLKNKFKLYGISNDKQALILTDAIGAKHYERLGNLCHPKEPETKSFDELSELLSVYFEPKPNKYAEY